MDKSNAYNVKKVSNLFAAISQTDNIAPQVGNMRFEEYIKSKIKT
jgi:hypothetical protein